MNVVFSIFENITMLLHSYNIDNLVHRTFLRHPVLFHLCLFLECLAGESKFRYYSKVVAVDVAGLKSKVVVSDGVVIDNTPPRPMMATNLGSNLLQNPSFELIPSELPIQGESFPPSLWNTHENTEAGVIKVGTDYAQDGIAVLKLFGSISQTVSTIIGRTYRVSIHVSHVIESTDPVLNQEGRIQIPGLDVVFKLYDRPALVDHHQNKKLPWLRRMFYFTASKEESDIILSSIGRSNGMLLDNIKVK